MGLTMSLLGLNMGKKIAFEVTIGIPQAVLDDFYESATFVCPELTEAVTEKELKENAALREYFIKEIIKELKEYSVHEIDALQVLDEVKIEKCFKKELAAAAKAEKAELNKRPSEV